MVRASYFIGYELWDRLSPNYKGWESWIRKEGFASNNFRIRQDFYQRIVVIFIPMIISIIALIVALLTSTIPIWLSIIILITTAIIWGILLVRTKRVSDLAAIREEKKQKNEE